MRQRAVHHKKPFSIGMRQRAVHRKNRRRAVSYVSTGLARLPRDTDAHATTAEERFNMLARGWFAYPVTPVVHATTAEERL